MENNAAEIILAERRNEERQFAPEIRDYRLVSWVRLILRIISTLTCILICMSLIDAICSHQRTRHVRNRFHDGSGSFLVWPEHEGLKQYPTYILLGAAVVAALFNIILVLAALTKAVRQMTTVGSISTTIVSALCLVLWVAVTAYYGSWDTCDLRDQLGSAVNRTLSRLPCSADSHISWTCTHRKFGYTDVDFGETCTEMRFAFWAGVSLAGLEAVNLALFVIWWLNIRRTRGYSKV